MTATMIPASSREALLRAMETFDREQRETDEWQGWQERENYKRAIAHEGHLYPVKHIASLATGVSTSAFSGGSEANAT